MTIIELKESLNQFTIFSINDVRKIEPEFDKRRLNEWHKKGYLKKVIRGHYIFSDLAVNENVLFEIANKIYNPSYVSLEIALSYYHLTPESVYEITSVATRKTNEFKTPIARFNYKSLKPNLFFGYKLVKYDQKSFKIAEVEKAILDYLYFNPRLKTAADFEGIRIDLDSFQEQVNQERLKKYLSEFNQKTFQKRVNDFLRFIKNA